MAHGAMGGNRWWCDFREQAMDFRELLKIIHIQRWAAELIQIQNASQMEYMRRTQPTFDMIHNSLSLNTDYRM